MGSSTTVYLVEIRGESSKWVEEIKHLMEECMEPLPMKVQTVRSLGELIDSSEGLLHRAGDLLVYQESLYAYAPGTVMEELLEYALRRSTLTQLTKLAEVKY